MNLRRNTPLLLFILPLMTACEGKNATESARTETPSANFDTITTKTYRVPEGYQYILADLAHKKTGDSSFSNGEGSKTLIREPWPSQSLKALGLQLRDGYSMTNRGDGFFFYAADSSGHEEFIRLNQSLGISIEQVKDTER